MANDLIDILVRATLALSAAIALVMALRWPARRAFGARVAYALWLTPPIAALAALIPARTIEVTIPHVAPPPPAHIAASAAKHVAAPVWESAAPTATPPPPIEIDPSALLLSLWIAGAAFVLLLLAVRQLRFMRALGPLSPRFEWGKRVFACETESAGPAVVGVLMPIIVTPADFEARFDAGERRIVLEHERAHLAHGDPLANAAAALMQCLFWFNPLTHIAVRALRVDQELACDERVVGAGQQARRAYAEAMLKTHAAPAHAQAPLACAWPGRNFHPLKERIAMLKRNLPSRAQRLIGVSAIVLAALGAGAAAWSAQPPRIIAVADVAPVADVQAPDEAWGADVARTHAALAAHVDAVEAAEQVAIAEAARSADEVAQAAAESEAERAAHDAEFARREAEIHTRSAAIEAQIRRGERPSPDELQAVHDLGRQLAELGRERGPSAEELARIRVDAERAGEDARRVEREIRVRVNTDAEHARHDAERAERHVVRIQRRIDGAEHTSAQAAELSQQLSALAAELSQQATQLAQQQMSAHGDVDTSRLEQEIEQRAEQMAELAMQMAGDMDIDIDVDMDVDAVHDEDIDLDESLEGGEEE